MSQNFFSLATVNMIQTIVTVVVVIIHITGKNFYLSANSI